ncbi:MAG: hypothetical protein NTY76_07950 [Candidatus Omnitrophica bacterium]|nr:hypothetical protein [Candidatus Omnitrophota bacterium]
MAITVKEMNRAAGTSKKIHTRDLQSALNDEIAKTFLRTSEKSYIRKKTTLRLAWSVAIVASILAVVAFITKINFDVRVRILGEMPSVSVERGQINFDNMKDKGVFLIKGISSNNDIVKSTFFDGDAKIGSRTADDHILLSNAKGSGWGNFTIDLKEPIGLNKLDLKFVARGSSGGEYLGIVIVDSDNKTYRMERGLSTKLTNEWQLYKVDFRPIKKAVDLANITTIKFEFGSLTVGNSSGAAIFLKDIYVAKARRSRWL